MRFRHRFLGVALAVLSLAPRPALALEWIVVPYGVSHPAAAMRAAERLVRALSERAWSSPPSTS